MRVSIPIYFQACFFGPVGAGKTKAADACLKLVGGSKQSKTDHQTKSQTIKKGMSFQTMPKVVDDMKSNSSAGNLVVSNFDDNTYQTSEGEFESYCETILTTNYFWDTRIISRCVVQFSWPGVCSAVLRLTCHLYWSPTQLSAEYLVAWFCQYLPGSPLL